MEQVSTAAIFAMFVTLAICSGLPVGLAAIFFVVRGKAHFTEIEIMRDEAEVAREEGY